MLWMYCNPTVLFTKKYGKAAKMELVFPGSIFYNVDIMNKLGVLCHADFR